MSGLGASQGRPRAMSSLALVVAVAAVGVAWSWAVASFRPSETALDVPVGKEADAIARRVEVAFADALGDSKPPATMVLYRGATSSACVTGTRGRGVFYCAETGTAAFDLGYLEALVARLKGEGDLGLALVAGRLAAEHRQREAGVLDTAALDMIGATRARRGEIGVALALQADCLTGAWAAAARERLGPVPEGFWSELVWSARNVAEDFAQAGRPIPPALDTFAPASRDARAAAFGRGYAAAEPGACPSPVRLALP